MAHGPFRISRLKQGRGEGGCKRWMCGPERNADLLSSLAHSLDLLTRWASALVRQSSFLHETSAPHVRLPLQLLSPNPPSPRDECEVGYRCYKVSFLSTHLSAATSQDGLTLTSSPGNQGWGRKLEEGCRVEGVRECDNRRSRLCSYVQTCWSSDFPLLEDEQRRQCKRPRRAEDSVFGVKSNEKEDRNMGRVEATSIGRKL